MQSTPQPHHQIGRPLPMEQDAARDMAEEFVLVDHDDGRMQMWFSHDVATGHLVLSAGNDQLRQHTHENGMAIFGGARTGKSFLINCLLDQEELAETSDNLAKPCTAGVNISSFATPLRTLQDPTAMSMAPSTLPADAMMVHLLDVEGQGDKSDQYDVNLLTPVLSLTKVVAYNWNGGIEKNTILARLGVLVRAAQNVCNTQAQAAGACTRFGHLHLIFRDWADTSSEMTEEVRAVVFDEEPCGPSEKEKIFRNEIRRQLAAAFESVHIWLLPPPRKGPVNVGKVAFAERTSAFLTKVAEFRAAVCEQLQEPMLFFGQPVSGPLKADLCRLLVNAINNSDMKEFYSAYSSFLQMECTRAVGRATNAWDRLVGVAEENELSDTATLQTRCTAAAHDAQVLLATIDLPPSIRSAACQGLQTHIAKQTAVRLEVHARLQRDRLATLSAEAMAALELTLPAQLEPLFPAQPADIACRVEDVVDHACRPLAKLATQHPDLQDAVLAALATVHQRAGELAEMFVMRSCQALAQRETEQLRLATQAAQQLEEFSTANARLAKQTKELKSARKALEQRQGDIEASQARVADMEFKQAELQSTIDQLTMEEQVAQQKAHELQADFEIKSQESEELRAALEIKSQEMEALQADFESKSQGNEELRVQVQKLTRELATALESLQVVSNKGQQEVTQLQMLLATKTQEIACLRQNQEQVAQGTDMERQQTQQTVRELKEQMEAMLTEKAELQATIYDATQATQASEQSLFLAKAGLQDQQAEVTAQGHRLAAYEEKLEQLKATAVAKDTETAAMVAHWQAELTARTECAQHTTRELDTLRQCHEQLQQQSRDQQTTHQVTLGELSTLRSQLATMVADLQKAHDHAAALEEARITHATQTEAVAAQDMQALREQLRVQEAECQLAQTQAAILERSQADGQRTAEAEMASIRGRLAETEAELTSAQRTAIATNMELQQHLDEARAKLACQQDAMGQQTQETMATTAQLQHDLAIAQTAEKEAQRARAADAQVTKTQKQRTDQEAGILRSQVATLLATQQESANVAAEQMVALKAELAQEQRRSGQLQKQVLAARADGPALQQQVQELQDVRDDLQARLSWLLWDMRTSSRPCHNV